MLDGKEARVLEIVVLERTDQLSHVVIARHRKVAAEEFRPLLREGGGARQQAARECEYERERGVRRPKNANCRSGVSR